MTTALATRPKFTFLNPTPLLDEAEQAPQLPVLRRKVKPMEVGLFPQDISDDEKSAIKVQIIAELEAIGIEPLEPKSISLGDRVDVRNSEDFTHWGALCPHDDVKVIMARRPISEFSTVGNSIPQKAKRILKKLQAAGMPLGWSLMVWVPQSATPIPDPMLVLELPTGGCIGLCYWIA